MENQSSALTPSLKKKTDRLRDQYKINDDIISVTGKVRITDPATNQSKEVALSDAIAIANQLDVDLVQITAGNVPVCKFVAFDKFLYQIEKQQKANAQHVKKTKTIKLSPNISEHDLGHKVKHIKEFITDGFKVEIFLRFQGREQSHKEFGYNIFQKVIDNTMDVAKIDTPMSMNGNNLTMILGKK